jgi:hypothetical protein
MFSMLFNLTLDKGPNRGYVSGDQCWLNVLHVVSYCCFWEHIDEHFKNLGKPLASKREQFKNTKTQKNNFHLK